MSWSPQEGPQTEFFKRQEFEVLYGGASGGGKTDALLAEGGRQAWHPRYRAYFFRRTYPELADAIDRAKEIFLPSGATWKEREFELNFPSGAKFRFRHMEHRDDWRKYQGHGIHCLLMDELTQFEKIQYDKIKAWVRSSIPGIRAYIRCASNPKGIGHAWVKARFVDHGAFNRVVEYITDPKVGLSFELDRVFIPARVYDNKILINNDPQYLARLLSMPEADRKAYLEGIWEGGEGQFFSEWDSHLHTVQSFEVPPNWRRFGMLDYGFATPFCYLQTVVSPDGELVCYREIYQHGVRDDEQAEKIYDLCKDDRPEYIVAGRDLWHKSGKGQHGQSTAETYRRVWDQHGWSVPLRMGDNDRVMGWRRIRLYLQPYVSGGGERTALLKVVATNCPNLVRTLPELQYDPMHPDDVLQPGPGYYMDGGSAGEDHAPEAFRLGVMSRPQPKLPTTVEPGKFDAAFLIRQYLRNRKKPLRIGGELEVRI